MKYCRQCGAEMKPDAVFCPKCGIRVENKDNIQVWQELTEQETIHESKGILNSEAVQNLVNKFPEGTKDQVKELSGKAAEGMTMISAKAKEYSGKLSVKAGEFKENTAQAIQERRRKAYQGEANGTVKEKKAGNGMKLLPMLVLSIIIIGIGAVYYLSRFTLVGVWQLAHTEKTNVDMSNFDLTNPEDLLEQSLLTLTSGTRIIFTKEGDVFAAASFAGATTGLGKMSYAF